MTLDTVECLVTTQGPRVGADATNANAPTCGCRRYAQGTDLCGRWRNWLARLKPGCD